MAKIIFNFNGKETMILCSIKETMKEITQSFANKISKNLNNLVFLYGGENIKPNLTFENQANQIDKNRLQMNVLVYESNNIVDNNKYALEESEINLLKEKISKILSKYLEDRKYIKDKVDNWRDAILKDCEKLFTNYIEYKSFIYIIIRDKKKINHMGRSNSFGHSNQFKVKFETNNIICSIYINIFSKKINRKKKDLRESLYLIEKEFLNLAEGRDYKIFKEKYFEIFNATLKDELLKSLKYSSIYNIDMFMNDEINSRGFIIVNKDKDDYFLSKNIRIDKYSLYILLGNVQ